MSLDNIEKIYESQQSPPAKLFTFAYVFVGQGYSKARRIGYSPPHKGAVTAAREQRIKELKMYGILREMAFYGVFLFVLIVLSYDFRDPMASTLRFHLHNQFGTQGLQHIDTFTHSFENVKYMRFCCSRFLNQSQITYMNFCSFEVTKFENVL